MEQFSEPINSYSTLNSGGERSWESDNPDHEEASKPIMCQSDIRKEFKLLVKNIAYDIKDLKKLIYISEAAQDGTQSALDILWELERKGEFAFNNVAPLEKLLQDIDRFDLISKHLVPYRLKYGESAVNSQKKPPPMRRVGSSPIPQGSPAFSTRRTTPISQHPRHERHLMSLPGSGPRYSVVPEEETIQTTEQLKQTNVFAQHGFASLPSDATVVPHSQSTTTWSIRPHTQTLSGRNGTCTTERPMITFTQHSRCSKDNEYSTPMTQQSHDHGIYSIHDIPQLSLPSNLSTLQHRSGRSSLSFQPHQLNTGKELPQGGACNHVLQPKETSNRDDESILEFPQPVSDMEASMTHSMQSQRSMQHQFRFEQTARPTSRNTGTPQRSEECHCWDVDQRLLFTGLKKIGKSLKAEKFTFSVGCKNSRNPAISMRVIPRESTNSRHVSLCADLLIPKKCSKRKWLVEYCSCSCVLLVKVIDPETNEVIGQSSVEEWLAGSPGVNDDYHITMKVQDVLHHDDIIYRNTKLRRFKFQATLCLLEHGFKEDVSVKDYHTSPNEDHGFEVIELP